jgi:U32 family peptidase
MNHLKNPPELLAPAGGWSQLRAALDAGADAVFFGAGTFNMRVRAKNFGLDDLAAVTAFCHEKGAKAYLTLNTVIYEAELAAMEEVVGCAKAAGVDAVIAADFAVIAAAGRHGLPVHVSTQMSVSNSATLALLHRMGIRRVVLARECSLDDLTEIRRNLGNLADEMEIEVFAHGAMCVAVSGRCFMSGFETGRSANRGVCAQPCRKEYDILPDRGGEGFKISGQHILSPKDLCTLPFLEKLLDTGVASLKIEGRNRSPDYVHHVVSAYRHAIDFYSQHRNDPDFIFRFSEIKDREMAPLQKVYNRGFSEGFYMGQPLGDWTSPPGNQSSHARDYVGQILQIDEETRRATLRLEAAGLEAGIKIFAESPEQGFVEVIPEEMERDGLPVRQAEKGTCITLPLASYMHKGLKFYQWTER